MILRELAVSVYCEFGIFWHDTSCGFSLMPGVGKYMPTSNYQILFSSYPRMNIFFLHIISWNRRKLRYATSEFVWLVSLKKGSIRSQIISALGSNTRLDKITINELGQVKMRNINKQIRLKCRMNYIWYPFDTQSCHHYIIINEKELTMDYNETKTFEDSRIQNSVHPDWTIQMERGQCPPSVTQSCFSLVLVLKRKIVNHIFQAYMPSLFLIISSVTSLFIPKEHMPARMSLSVTTALAMITLLSSNSWPKTAYLKAIDIWAILCYITVFYTLISYCLALALASEERRRKVEKIAKIFVPIFLLLFSTTFFVVCFHNRLL